MAFLFLSFLLPSLMAFTKGEFFFFFPLHVEQSEEEILLSHFPLFFNPLHQLPVAGRHQQFISSSLNSWGYHQELAARDEDGYLNRFQLTGV